MGSVMGEAVANHKRVEFVKTSLSEIHKFNPFRTSVRQILQAWNHRNNRLPFLVPLLLCSSCIGLSPCLADPSNLPL